MTTTFIHPETGDRIEASTPGDAVLFRYRGWEEESATPAEPAPKTSTRKTADAPAS